MSTRNQSVASWWLRCVAVLGIACVSPLPNSLSAGEAERFTPLMAIPAPQIIAAAEAFSESYRAENILKPPTRSGHRADYASRGHGARTFIDFDFGRPVPMAAFRHIQRRTPDTIAEANLVFSDEADFSHVLAMVKVTHVDEPGATTFAAFTPINARYVRWQVTSVLPGRSPNVGGQSMEFFAAAEAEAEPRRIDIQTRAVPIVERKAIRHGNRCA